MSANAPDITVIIATRSREGQLAKLLQTLAAQQTGGAFTYEVLVADNGSTDDTADAVRKLQATFPAPLRYLYEGRPGKPWALNAALADARGGIFAFADDDIEAEPGWLAGLWSCFKETGADAVTGRALPRWIGQKPAWLTDAAFRHIGGMGCIDWGAARLSVRDGADCRWVGGNMAIRRAAVEKIGGFDVRMLRGQDTEYYHRAAAHKLHVAYEPQAVSHHKIPAERLSPGYFRQWRSRSGRFQVHLIPWKASHLLSVMPGWRYRKTGLLAWLWLKALVSRAPAWERFGYALMLREDISIWRSRLALWPRWWLTVLTGRPFLPQPGTAVALRGEHAVAAAPQLPFVSVVVPVLNAQETIAACVKSLLAQDYPSDSYEVLIVDNGSTDDTAAIVKGLPVMLLSEVRRGSYAARNRGIAASRGDMVAFTDADCVADGSWLSRLVEGCEDGLYGAFAGGVAAQQSSSLLQRFAAQRQQVSNDASMACSFMPYAITANVACRREALAALGGFDERLVSGGDADLSWRLQQAGWRIRYNRTAVVRHAHRGSLRSLIRQHKLYGWGTAMLYARYPGYRKSAAYELWHWLSRSSRFVVRGLFRLLRDPLARRDGGLYVATHFLEALVTTARFTGMFNYWWKQLTTGAGDAVAGPLPPARSTEPAVSRAKRGPPRCEDGRRGDTAAGPAPVVSVVIPSYNRAHLVGQAIESALAQSFRDFEIIVVDDGSSDNTRAVVEAFIRREPARIRYIFQQNQGLSAARNAGCRASRSRFVAFLDSDDLWKPEKLARQVAVLEADASVGLVSSMAEVVDAANARVLGIKPKQVPGATLTELVERGSAAPSSFVARREALQEVDYFDPLIAQGIEDLDLCLRLAPRWKLVCMDEPLIRYRQHDSNISSDPVGTCRGFIRTYEKLLASADGSISRNTVRQRLAKNYYVLGKTYAQQRRGRKAVAALARALGTSPLIGLAFADEKDGMARRCLVALKPYAALCAAAALAVLPENGP